MAKGLALLLGSKPKGGSDMGPPEGKDDEGMSSAKMTAAEDLIAAQESGDAKGVADAFQRMYDACAMGGGYEDDEE
jgi:hypothetical protein